MVMLEHCNLMTPMMTIAMQREWHSISVVFTYIILLKYDHLY